MTALLSFHSVRGCVRGSQQASAKETAKIAQQNNSVVVVVMKACFWGVATDCTFLEYYLSTPKTMYTTA